MFSKITQDIMGTSKGAHYILSITLLFLLLIALFVGRNYAFFEVKIHTTDKVVYKKLVKIGDTITLDYIHSVTNQPVYETFKVKNKDTLALVEMRYDSFGANLPVGPEKLADETTRFFVEEGYYKITYPNREFDKVPLRVGQVVANHALTFSDGNRLRLLDIANGGAYIEYYVKPVLSI